MPPQKDILKEIISDFHQRPLPSLTPRDIKFEILPSKIMTLVGVRRSGKTFCFFQIMESLLKKGVPKENLLFISFEDERLTPMPKEGLSLILEAYFELYPQKKTETVYVFFDEIHNVEGWEQFVRRVQDSEKVRVFLTGSSAKLLSREIATSLRGRTLTHEVFPFSFSEYLKHLSVNHPARSSQGKARVQNAFSNYLERGGFPETIGCSETTWRMILQDYLNLIVYKDIAERHALKNQPVIKYLVKFLLQNAACAFSINKIYNDLKSQGLQVAKDTLHLYLGYLEDAYSFYTVPIFSDSIRTQHVNPRKVYSVDSGFIRLNFTGISEKRGAILENLVFLHLRRNMENTVFYHRTSKGSEIDFVATQRGRIEGLFQVCEQIENRETRDRELKALWDGMEELDQRRSSLVTLDQKQVLKKGKKEIHVVPASEFFLTHPDS